MAVRLVVCDCNRHARLVLADGSEGAEFCFKDHGRMLILKGMELGIINDADAKEFERLIEECELPATIDDVDLLTVYRAESINTIMAESDEKVDANYMHDVIMEPLPPGMVEVPDDFKQTLFTFIAPVNRARPQ